MLGAPSTLRVVPPLERTIPVLLERQAERHGSRTLLRGGGRERSFVDVRDAAAGYATCLTDAGVHRGDRVAVMSENRPELIELWLGCAWLGAVLVPINTALRGAQISHVLRDSGPRLLVLEPTFRAALDFVEQDLPALVRTWTLGEPGRAWRGLPNDVFPAPAEPSAAYPARPGDPCAILYTSGTTGPSKGVVCPQAQWYWWGVLTGEILGVTADDVLYTCLPLYHTNALNAFMQALVAGAAYTAGPRFSASAFWPRLVDSGATVTYLLGAMAHILAKQEPVPLERAHSVRVALSPATPVGLHEPFRERFGIRLVDGWGSTETNVVLSTAVAGSPPGTMGAVTPGFDARVVDENDEEVVPGSPGELVVRSELPFAFATGYLGLPDKTVEAWRNLWFHTGDRVVRDADGFFTFLDRIKDSIRRRGENISSYEVEVVLAAHPGVAAAAVVPVPSEVGEDEVMACVVPRGGITLRAEELVAYCEPRLAYFAIPRYVQFLEQLPLTSSGKVEKYRLREVGVTSDTWDRERAGYVLRR